MTAPTLYRTETAIRAMSATTLAWNTWPRDNVHASGVAAIWNPLGNAMMHWIDSPCGQTASRMAMLLDTQLRRRGEIGNIQDIAFQAIDYWDSRRCLTCGGNGVVDIQQTECPRCGGEGDRPIPSEYAEAVKTAIGMLLAAEAWCESQLSKKLRDITSYEVQGGYLTPKAPSLEEYDTFATNSGGYAASTSGFDKKSQQNR